MVIYSVESVSYNCNRFVWSWSVNVELVRYSVESVTYNCNRLVWS